MRCPFCSHEETMVKDSRPTEDNGAIRRRRLCDQCGARFTTFERVQLRELTVVKSDGAPEPFDRDKLQRSLELPLRKRPIEQTRIDQVMSGIVRRLETLGESEITTRTIGAMVMEALKSLDAVAYVRYASVYNDFRDTNDFNAFVAGLGGK